MTLDYLVDDKRFLTSAGVAAFCGSVAVREIVRKKFIGIFAFSGFAAAFMAFDAFGQFNAHRAYFHARCCHDSIQGQKIALIAQTQKLVPISTDEQMLQINKVRTLLQFGLYPYIAIINDFESLNNVVRKAAANNEIKALWIRSDFNEKNLYFSYGEINPFPQLSVFINRELKRDTPVIIERDFEAFLFTHAGNPSATTSVSGKDALEAALVNFNQYGLSFKAEKSSVKI